MTTDVIIAGGGPAGATMAAALAEFGYNVLIVEPGLHRAKRLAGELIHPPGAADLSELGLLNCLEKSGAIPVQGFAVFGDHDLRRQSCASAVSASTGAYLLPYIAAPGHPRQGLAIEHSIMGEALLQQVTRCSRVSLWDGARVTAVDLSRPDAATVTITRSNHNCQVSTQLLIAADGRNSRVCRMAGIGHKQAHISNMIGYSVSDTALPHSGFGHVFIGGPAPVMAYAVNLNTTRIMFDLPPQAREAAESEFMQKYLDALPVALRNSILQAMRVQTPLRAANCSIIPETVIKGRLVCAGDSGGCCHPLTATGLSACTRDAIRLRQALRETNGDIPSALRRYAKLRKGPQRTRVAGAELLYQVFRAQTPETRLLRQGLLQYWQQSARGRASTIALLSTEEDRPVALVREYLRVCRYALPRLISWHRDGEGEPVRTRSHAMLGLSRALLKVLAQTGFG